MARLVCPHCGFAREISDERLPKTAVRATCPKCRQTFRLPGRAGGSEELQTPEPEQAPPTDGASLQDQDRPQMSLAYSGPPEPKEAAPTGTVPGESTEELSPEVMVACPHCGFRRQVRREILPERPSRVSCSGCRRLFTVSREAGAIPEIPPVPELQTAASTIEEPAPASGKRPPLPGVKDLFRRSWEVFRRRIWTYIGIILLGGVLALVPAMLAGNFRDFLTSTLPTNPYLAIAAILAVLVAAVVVVTWLSAALLYAVAHEEVGVRQALGLGLQRLWAFSWLYGLLGFVIGGGWLLFLVPGILFTLWFVLAQFVLAAEDVEGMEALLKSREYVRGYGGPVFLRLLVLWLATTCLSVLLCFVPLLGQLVSLLLIPFSMIYHYLLYRDLRGASGSISYACSRRAKLKWVGLAALGYILPPLLAAVLLLSHPGARGLLPAGLTFRPAAAASSMAAGHAVNPQSAMQERPRDVLIRIEAINYTGTVRVNGEEFYRLGGEPNRNYTYSAGSDRLRYGKNTIEVGFESLPHPPSDPRLKMKVFRRREGVEEVLSEWEFKDVAGSQQLDVEIPSPSRQVR